MRLILFLIIFSHQAFSQQVEISATAYSIISGYTSYYQIQDRENYKNGNDIYLNYSLAWHKLQFLEAVSLINVGIQIDNSDRGLPKKITDIFLTGAIRWIIRDGTYQLLNGNSFFYQSKQTTSILERLGTPLIKISFLLTVLIFKYFILPIL